MNTKIRLSKIVFALFFVVSLIAAPNLGAQSIFDIEFPIAELGNCGSKQECKAHCDSAENRKQCRDFAAKYNIGGAADDREDAKIRQAIADGGPGNCAASSDDPEASCHRFCSAQKNMRECVSYAKKHGLMERRELEEAEKVLKALESGVPLPAGCTDQFSCREVCENPKDVSAMRSCFDFAEKAGLLPPDVNREKAEKMFRLIESGKAPFKSPRDFEKCEDPENDEILEKCINFGIESGFIPPEEAEMIRKTGGKGPGGCRGREQCEQFCRNNQEVCMSFAEQYGFMRPEDKRRMMESQNMQGPHGEMRDYQSPVDFPQNMSREEMERMMREKMQQYGQFNEEQRRQEMERIERERMQEYERFRQLQNQQYSEPSYEQYRQYEQYNQPYNQNNYSQPESFESPPPEGSSDFQNAPINSLNPRNSDLLANVISLFFSLFGQ